MSYYEGDQNLDQEVINSFDHEWKAFDYSDAENNEALDRQFLAYSTPINFDKFNTGSAVTADFGAGSGRWTSKLVPYFLLVYAFEPSDGASRVLFNKFNGEQKVKILQKTVGANSIPAESLDFAVSLGVLQHIPDTRLAIKDIAL